MNCRRAERLILRRRDGRLSPVAEANLNLHLGSCPACREIEAEYARLFDDLAAPSSAVPRPMFWPRLEARMAERERENGWGVVRRWCRRAVPAALGLTAAFLAALLVLSPGGQSDLSSSETLLLRDENPLRDARTLLEENRVEAKNMMLIFASGDDYSWAVEGRMP
jgi:predicted anti-sigma-YlaC factor YlaD